MQPIAKAYPDLVVAYCVHYGIVDVRLSSRDRKLSMEQLKAIGQEVRVLLGEDFVCFGHCSLAKVVFHELRALDRPLPSPSLVQAAYFVMPLRIYRALQGLCWRSCLLCE